MKQGSLSHLLLRAAWHGDIDGCKTLLTDGADINCTDRANLTPLMLAVLHNHVGVVRLLVQHGCDLTATSNTGRTVLHLAVWNKRTTVTCYLLRHGAAALVNRQDHFCDTPLMLAASRGYSTLVKAILRSSPHCDLHMSGSEHNTALHYAAKHGQPDCVKLLHKGGADLERRNSWEQTALCAAIVNGNPATALMLIRCGADVNSSDNTASVLHHAVRCNMTDVIQELLLKQANLEAKECCGSTPLVTAILHSSYEVIVQLLNTAYPNVDAKGTYKAQEYGLLHCSALEIALHTNRLPVAHLLVQAGCDIAQLRQSIYDRGHFGHKMASDLSVRDFIQNLLHIPQSLVSQARRHVIKLLRNSKAADTSTVTVPPGLRNYLSYGDSQSSLNCKPNDKKAVCHVSHMQVLVRH